MDYQSASIDFLRHVVEVTQQKPSVLAKMVGKAPSTFTRPLQDGWKGSIKLDTLMELSERTGIPLPEDLVGARAADVPESGMIKLPIKFEVAASGFLPRDELPQVPYGFKEVQSLKGFEGCPQWLERVVSDSMDRIIPQGSLVHVVDAYSIRYRPKDGDVVIAERERGGGSMIERTVKQVGVEDGTVKLWPRSHNQRWQTPLVLTEGTAEGEEFTVQIVGRVLRSFQDHLT